MWMRRIYQGMSAVGVGSSARQLRKMRRLRPLHVCLSVWSSQWRKSRRTAVVILILIATTVAACRAVSISPFYQQQVGSIKFTAGVAYTYVPKGAETPTGEGGCSRGLRVLTDNYLYISYLELPTCLGL